MKLSRGAVFAGFIIAALFGINAVVFFKEAHVVMGILNTITALYITLSVYLAIK